MIHARRALLPFGWAADVRITVAGGRIAAVTQEQPAWPQDVRVDTLLPALSNLHSHTFQRAMAGLTEYRAAGRESFWTWRDLMYRFLERLTPDDVEAVAAQVFLEMQEAGFAAVAEFHYLHHQPGGAPYGRLAEMGERIMAAADVAGIGLTLLPVLYTYGAAREAEVTGGQLRFANDRDRYARLLDATRQGARSLPGDTVVGVAPHSLRAISPLRDLGPAHALAEGAPFHLHIAEQPAEVEQISAWLGARPVEWVLANAKVGPDWCAIHATHMTPAEAADLARTGAVAGLCPVTEANLGDGPFAGPAWIAAGGVYGVGSDSNVRISLVEELRTLEYSQRLRDLSRNVMVAGEGSVGAAIYGATAAGGARALGRASGAIAPGLWADLMAVDGDHPALAALPDGRLLDGLVFAAPDAVVTDVWAAGRHTVTEGRHVARDRIVPAFRAAARRLRAAI